MGGRSVAHGTIEESAAGVERDRRANRVRFQARDINLAMRSREGSPVLFRVLIDGDAPGPAQGLDVDATGHGTLVEPRLYQLVREPGSRRGRFDLRNPSLAGATPESV